MTIRFNCTSCGRALAAPPKFAGRKLRCPDCNTIIRIPSAEAAAPAKGRVGTSANREESDTAGEEPPADHPLLLFASRAGDHGNLIDMTAMVDIVFFLLIFFLVTSMQALEAVINLPTPQASENASSNVQAVPDYANDPSYVVVTIDAEDAVYVEGEEAMSEQDLRAKLRAALQEDEREGMLINGAGDATHGKFVMILDAGADAGVKELLFSVDQTEEEADGG